LYTVSWGSRAFQDGCFQGGIGRISSPELGARPGIGGILSSWIGGFSSSGVGRLGEGVGGGLVFLVFFKTQSELGLFTLYQVALGECFITARGSKLYHHVNSPKIENPK
jgi:hypothetical protein